MHPGILGAKCGAPRPSVASLSLALLSLAICLGCGSRPPPDSAPSELLAADLESVSASGSTARVASFSADRAWRDLQALTDIGARPVGSRGNDRARDYLRAELEDLGLAVESWDVDYASAAAGSPGAGAAEIRVTNLSAIIPGTRSQDRFVIAAPFDSQHFDGFEFVGANDGASGAAVALEIARTLAANPLPYATEIVFLDGESPFRPPAAQRGGSYRAIGSLGLASRLQRAEHSGVRLLIYLNRVGDADLRIARDLGSHRIYREEIWKAAAALDRTQAFPRDAAFENAGIAREYFAQIGLREIVSIADTSFGGDQPPGLYAGTAQDTIDRCAPESLETVGVVVLEALDAISKRLGKIDRFATSHGANGDER